MAPLSRSLLFWQGAIDLFPTKTKRDCSLCHALCCRVCFILKNAHEDFEISAKQEDGCTVEEVIPNFWPVSIYNAHFPEEAHIDMVKKRQWKGKTVEGVYVPDDGRPLPTGVLKLKNFEHTSVEKKTTVEKGDQQWDSDRAEATRRSMAQKAMHQVKATAKHVLTVAKRDGAMEAVEVSDTESSTPKAKRGKKRGRDEGEDDEDEDGMDFGNLLFGSTGSSGSKDKKKKDDKKSRGSKIKKQDNKTVKPVAKVKASPPKKRWSSGKLDIAKAAKQQPLPASPAKSGSAMPEWRLRHNKQRKLQQHEQHLLLGKQALETFSSAIATTSVEKIARPLKLLGEMQEYDSVFMELMKDDTGMMVAAENIEKVCS